MNKILAILLVAGILLIPVLTLAGVCGMGDDCQYCMTETPCVAQPNCAWETSVCVFDGKIPFTAGIITQVMGLVGNFFSDLSLLVVLMIGLPLGFWVITRVIASVKPR